MPTKGRNTAASHRFMMYSFSSLIDMDRYHPFSNILSPLSFPKQSSFVASVCKPIPIICLDMHTKMESNRLLYIREHQNELQVENAMQLGDNSMQSVGCRYILPSKEILGICISCIKLQSALYVDSGSQIFTCNSRWPEIQDSLISPQQTHSVFTYSHSI